MVFHKMWMEVAQRLMAANQYSLTKTITYEDVLNFMREVEQLHMTEIEEYAKKKKDEEVKNETGLDPV